MNRIDSIVTRMTVTAYNAKQLEAEYRDKNKGTIYRLKRDRLVLDAKRYKKELDEFGVGQIKHWKVTFYDNREIHHKVEFCLPGDITSDEIITYYESVHSANVETVAEIQTVNLGFIYPSSKTP